MNIEKISWEEFLDTGLLMLVNMFLQAFGLSIIIEREGSDNRIVDAYPAKVNSAGFSEDIQNSSFEKIFKFIKEI